MCRLIFALVVVLTVSCATVERAARTAGSSQAVAAFPGGWVGTWSGEVVAYSPAGGDVRFEMTRVIAATGDPDEYQWTTLYSGESGDQTRAYTLLVRDAGRGAYAIDEHNGIVLDARLLDGTLYSWFEVRGNRLLVREQLERTPAGERVLSFEVVSGSGPSTATGDAIGVTNFPVGSLQRATLRRVGDGGRALGAQ